MRRAAILMLGALLAGCATLPGPAEPGSWTLEGRLALRSPSGGQAFSIRWEQRGDAFEIRLAGPLGQGATLLRGDAARVDIERPGEPPVEGEDPERLMRRFLGWSIPIEHVRHWVRGEPSPLTAVGGIERDASGRINGFDQSGFAVRIERSEVGSLPRRVEAERGSVRMVLRVRRWWPSDGADSTG